MLRSGQMMLAETLMRHTIGRKWRLSTGGATLSTQHKPILRMIADHPNAGASPFSIQQLSALGAEKYGKRPRDWYGPELFSQIVGDLMNGSEMNPGFGQALGIQTIVARGSVVYRDVVESVFGGGDEKSGNGKSEKSGKSSGSASLFLLIPVRLGLHDLDEDYISEILHFLEMSSCVGIIGGRPSHSLYFVGSVQPSDSSSPPQLVYLDPHFEQSSCTLSETFPTLNDLKTYHQPNPLAMNVNKIDPGLAFGFYCKTKQQLDELLQDLEEFRSHQNTEPTFYVEDSASKSSSGGGGGGGGSGGGKGEMSRFSDSWAESEDGSSAGGDSPKRMPGGSRGSGSGRADDDDEWTFL